jgi:hypothetical protein
MLYLAAVFVLLLSTPAHAQRECGNGPCGYFMLGGNNSYNPPPRNYAIAQPKKPRKKNAVVGREDFCVPGHRCGYFAPIRP